jgi:large subunit ribosomal protein L17
MLSNMACSLIKHKRIETTTAKAKALKRYVEPLITRSKEDSTHSRRVVFSYLQDKETVAELFRDVAAKVADRPGGYTRIIRLGNRLGDNADMCLIELVDFNENMLAEKAASKKSSSRRRRGSKAKTEDANVEAPEAAAEEQPVVEAVTATEGTEAPAEEQVVEATEEPKAATEETEAVAQEPKAEAPAEEQKADDKPETEETEEEKKD